MSWRDGYDSWRLDNGERSEPDDDDDSAIDSDIFDGDDSDLDSDLDLLEAQGCVNASRPSDGAF